MHPGSGPSDRHNDDLFGEVRPLFLAAGVAVASFDKRGVGGSGGDWRDAAIEDQADDLLAAVAAVRHAVPSVPVGVYGHSQGGWVVVEAAGRADVDLAFVVSSSGPAVSMVDQEPFAVDRAPRPGPGRGRVHRLRSDGRRLAHGCDPRGARRPPAGRRRPRRPGVDGPQPLAPGWASSSRTTRPRIGRSGSDDVPARERRGPTRARSPAQRWGSGGAPRRRAVCPRDEGSGSGKTFGASAASTVSSRRKRAQRGF